MRIERLHLERYGAFTDRTLELRPGAPLHVVLGANEAGKTSALSAIGDLLFGFGHVTKYDFLHEQKALRVGAALRLADGASLSIRRRKGAKNTLLDGNDKPLADDLLAPLLGAITRDSFFAEFGLTSQALRDGGQSLLQANGRLAETLAASSSQLSALTKLRVRLEAEADALFGSRRAESKAFYAALKQHEDAQRRLREAIVPADALREAESAVADARDRRASLEQAHLEQGRGLALRERAQRTRPKLSRLDGLRQELRALADLPAVDAATLQDWRNALEREARIAAELQKQDVQVATDAAAIAALNVDQNLLDQAKRIEALRERLGGVREAEKDLPSRRTRLRVERDAMDALARRLGVGDGEALLAHQPTDAALARAAAAIERRVETERRLADARDALALAEVETMRLDAETQKLGAHVDPEPLRRRFDLFAEIPTDAAQLRRETLAQERMRARLAEDAARLDPPAGAPDELARRALPDLARIEAARQDLAALEAAGRQAKTEINALQKDLATVEAEVAKLSSGAGIATQSDLATARATREQSYEALGGALDGDATQRRELFYRLGFAHRDLDATTDLLLAGAERSARLESARERLASLTRRKQELEAQEETRLARWREAEEAWRTLWAPSGLAPKGPEIMAVWRKEVGSLLQRRREIDDAQHELRALSRKLEEQRDGLTRIGADMGEAFDAATPLEIAHKQLRAAVERLNDDWSAARATLALFDRAKQAKAQAERDVAEIERDLAGLVADWPETLAAIGLEGAATPVEAKAALAVWREAPLHRLAFAEESHRIEAMSANISAFEKDVAAVVAEAAPHLAEFAPREALEAISAALKEAQRALTERATLQKAQQMREAQRVALQREREAATATLDAARATLGLAKDAPLQPVLHRLADRLDLEGKCAEALRDLAETADGRSEANLVEEQSDLDMDALGAELEHLRLAQSQTLADLSEAAKQLHEAERRCEDLSRGHDAAGAASDKAEAAAELLDVARRWLQRAAAAKLAAHAIERHRASVQDPLLARAEALFAIATDGAFAKLGVDYDDKDTPTLVGLRANGQRVPVAGMSEGARDQLFLALRLALLELRAAEPLPFIGDDLLASFDDARTKRALDMLADFGRGRQAILFTHHRHVAELAARNPAIDVVAL